MDARHWDDVYATKDVDAVSWFEAEPRTSARLVRTAAASGDVVDVGAGASTLADVLVGEGYGVTVLDLSAEALGVVRARLGDRIEYVVSDVLAWRPGRSFDVWHDRAVFHFLTDQADQAAYVAQAAAAVRLGGSVVIGTFGPEGPEACSGLATARHDADSLARLFGPDFALVRSEQEEHVTPWGAPQAFTWAVLTRASTD